MKMLGYMVCVGVLGAGLLTGCEEQAADRSEQPAIPARTQQPEATEATRVKFNTLIEQVTQHLRNRNFQAADTALAELDSMQTALDEPMRQQLALTRAAVSAARGEPGQAESGGGDKNSLRPLAPQVAPPATQPAR